ncbi:MAG: DUF1553 domain-containing protein [Pirellulaceae bacterium]
MSVFLLFRALVPLTRARFLPTGTSAVPGGLFRGLLTLVISTGVGGLAWGDDAVEFNRDIRQILASNCLMCHGPDEETREAGLRLDQREAAIGELESGLVAIIPGQPDESELLQRILSDDAGEQMPPPHLGKHLKPAEIDLLRKWIAAGAPYAEHWSFVPPQRAEPPNVSDSAWVRDPLDAFVLARLDAEQLKPAPEADRYALARRWSLAITGLPPTIEQVDAYVQDESPEADARFVDRLLEGPAYGERWARVWLDMARYADSAGYAQDPERTIWKYRDWVIQALNNNMPYDQFTIEQLAGDLLESPTEEQLIATAFHRNTMTNSEGGTNDEEFRNVAVVDRVNTTLAVWMGLTMECAQCHTHKYDPITHEDYFRFFAIFNSSEDADRGDEAPVLNTWTPELERQKESLQSEIATVKQEIEKASAADEAYDLAENPPRRGRYVRVEHPAPKSLLHIAEVQVFAGEENVALSGTASQSSVDYDGAPNLAIDGNTNGEYFAAMSTIHTKTEDNPWWEVDLKQPTEIEKIVVWNRTDGGLHSRMKTCRVVILDEARNPVWVSQLDQPFTPSAELAPPETFAGLDERHKKLLADYSQSKSPELVKLEERLKGLEDRLAQVRPIPTPIMRELPPEKKRATHIQLRGNYQALGDPVEPGVLSAFHSLPEGAEPNRLTAARWLMDPQNPLTARVVVNRYWEQLFGLGLVETSEDFGTQGELPTHPELLDQLALDLIENDWDIQYLIRRIVHSATYRQAALSTPEKIERDPRNQLLSRGPRFRLPAEMVRDQALAVSGLLSEKMLGPSVRPPRPNLGLSSAFGGSTDWTTSPGEDRYRRGLYTSWRRTTPYPSMVTFDAPSREVCTIRRISTNTPLQALVTLNDPVYVEASQALGRRIAAHAADNLHEKIRHGLRLTVLRPPSEAEVDRLAVLYEQALAHYQTDTEAATKLATDPLGPLPDGANAAELAAWTVVGNVLLNSDEFLNR